MLLRIAQMGNPVLRQAAKPVPVGEIKDKTFQLLIDSMISTLREEGGIGLAGPQVYALRRVFIVEISPERDDKGTPLHVFINPEIIHFSADIVDDWEGCLSIPDLRGMVPRSNTVVVRAYDKKGKPFELEASGLFARVVQHELDHLDGTLFLDRMRDMQTLTMLSEFDRARAALENGTDLADNKL